MRKMVVVVLVLIMLMALFVGCSETAGTADEDSENTTESVDEAADEAADEGEDDDTIEEPSEEAITLALIPLYRKVMTSIRDIENALISRCEEYGYEYVVLDPDADFAKLLQCIEDAVTMEVDGIVMAPWNEEALLPILEDVAANGIPIVTFDGYLPNGGETITCAVQFDFENCGTEFGKLIEEYVTENGIWDGSTKLQTAVIDYPASTAVGVPIIDNSVAYLEQAGIIEVVAQQDGQADRNTAMGVMENILTQTKGNVDLLIGFNYDACMGGVEAADAYGLSGEMIAFSQLWGEEAFLQLEEDDPIYKGGIAYSPVVMAETAIDMMYAHFEGTLENNEVICEPSYFIHDNIFDFDWRAIVEARS